MEGVNTVPIQSKPWLWQPGQSGNPAGKPKGSKHFQTLFKEAVVKIAEGEADSDDKLIVRKVITKAKEGDLKAAEMVMDRTDGKITEDEKGGNVFNIVVVNFDEYSNSSQLQPGQNQG